MKTIWKFPFEVTDTLRLSMPDGASIIHVGVQKGQPCIWAIVDPEAYVVPFTFYLRGTGHSLTGEEGVHIGSFQMYQGDLVFHLFEVKRMKTLKATDEETKTE